MANDFPNTPNSTMLSMGAFIASGGMDTLRDHAIAVIIRDVLTDHTHHQTFVDFRFRFISQQARTFFLKSMTIHEATIEKLHPVYMGADFVQGKLISLISDDSHPVNHVTSFQASATAKTSVKHRSLGQAVRKSDAESAHQDVESRGVVETLKKVNFLPDTSWIARKDPLSTILQPGTKLQSFLNENRETIDKPRHTASPSYHSDSSDASGHITGDGDHEFAFIGPRQRRASSLMETQDSVELARNYWKIQ